MGNTAIVEFCEAVAVRIRPDWANRILEEIKNLERKKTKLEPLSEYVSMLRCAIPPDSAANARPGVFATHRGGEKPPKHSRGDCPYRLPNHRWDPVRCQTLKSALTNDGPKQLPEDQAQKIRNRFADSKWDSLRDRLKQQKWNLLTQNGEPA